MYQCQRCQKTFDKKEKFLKHLKNDVPCDLYCNICGSFQTSRSSYQRHAKKTCEPVVVDKIVATNINNGVNGNNTINGNNNKLNINIHNNVNSNNNIYNIKDTKEVKLARLDRMGIYPIEDEQKDLLKTHYGDLFKYINDYIKLPDEQFNDDKKKLELLINIIRLFHSNKNSPEYMNIIKSYSQEKEMDTNQIFIGKGFIDDILPEKFRNKRVLQLIIVQLTNFSELPYVEKARKMPETIRETIIPFISKLYKNEDIPIDFGSYWRYNKFILDSIKNISFNSNKVLMDEEIAKQPDKYIENEMEILQTDLENTDKQMVVFKDKFLKRNSKKNISLQRNNIIAPSNNNSNIDDSDICTESDE